LEKAEIVRLTMLAQDDYPHRIVGCWWIFVVDTAPVSLILAKVFQGKSSVFQNLEKQALRKIACVDRNDKGLATGMFEN
jgi:hypothetical protein